MNTKNHTPKAIILCGPTGIGKTGFAVDLACRFGGEIVGADSMQIYRRMTIGTAKPMPQERARVRHHMVDIVEPDEAFDAERYGVMAFGIVKDLWDRGIPPFVVGGTGLYIKALVHGLFDAAPSDRVVRERLKAEFRQKGGPGLRERLRACDPETAGKLHVNDIYRIVRALEVYEIEGVPISEFHRRHRFRERRLTTLSFGLDMPRDELYQRIDARVDQMIGEGLLEEVRQLMAAGFSPNLKSIQSIGYRHMADFIEGRIDWEEALRTLKRDTRRYAKRQLTWFRADPEIVWIPPQNRSDAERSIERFLSKSDTQHDQG